MPNLELKHYKRWSYILAFALLFTAGLAYNFYCARAKDPMCQHVEAKYQFILRHGMDIPPADRWSEGPDAQEDSE